MPIRIRLARHGQRHSPVFHLVAIKNTKARDAKPLEKLGEYDPIPRVPRELQKFPPSANVFGDEAFGVQKEKRIEWNVERIRYWLGVGAEPTRSVVKLLERGGVLTTPHKWQHPWSPPPADSAKVAAAAASAASASAAAQATSAPEAEPATPAQ